MTIVNSLLQFRIMPQGSCTHLRPRIDLHPICARRIKGIYHRSRPPIVVTWIPRQARLLRMDELPSRYPACCSLAAYMTPLDSVKAASDNVFRSC